MDVTRLIQVNIARADLLICRLLAMPWEKIGLSLLIAAAVMYVVKAVRSDGKRYL